MHIFILTMFLPFISLPYSNTLIQHTLLSQATTKQDPNANTDTMDRANTEPSPENEESNPILHVKVHNLTAKYLLKQPPEELIPRKFLVKADESRMSTLPYPSSAHPLSLGMFFILTKFGQMS